MYKIKAPRKAVVDWSRQLRRKLRASRQSYVVVWTLLDIYFLVLSFFLNWERKCRNGERSIFTIGSQVLSLRSLPTLKCRKVLVKLKNQDTKIYTFI